MPSGPVPEPPPLPAPRTPPPPPSQDLLDIAQPLDQEMGSCENEEELEWQPVRRFTHLDRRNKLGVIKGFTKQRHEKRLPASKHVILEDDELTENTGNDLQSGEGNCGYVVQHASREALGSCAKLSREHVAEVCAERFCCACAYGCFNTSKFQWVARPDTGTGTRPKRHAIFKFSVFGSHVGPGSAKTDSFFVFFLRPPPTSSFTGVVAGTGMALSPASGSFSSVSAGMDDSCLTETKDHEMDGDGGSAEMQAGRPPPPPAVTPLCGQRARAETG